jgi:hypothetical protein
VLTVDPRRKGKTVSISVAQVPVIVVVDDDDDKWNGACRLGS